MNDESRLLATASLLPIILLFPMRAWCVSGACRPLNLARVCQILRIKRVMMS